MREFLEWPGDPNGLLRSVRVADLLADELPQGFYAAGWQAEGEPAQPEVAQPDA